MNEQKKRIGIFLCAVLVSAALSVAVFAVAGYDSSADPLISQSYLIKYIQDHVITPQDTKYSELESKILAIEEALEALLNNYTPPSDPGTGGETSAPDVGTSAPGSSESPETLESIIRLTEKLASLEKVLNSRIMEYYISNTSYMIEGGFYCYQKKYLERFSVPWFNEEELEFLRNANKKDIDSFLVSKYDLAI